MNIRCVWMKCMTGRFCLLLLLCLVGITAVAAAEPTTPSCALITDHAFGLDTSSLVGMFETKLLESTKVHLLERTELNKLLNEQTLSQIFDPEGGITRIATGKLLKADVLLLLKAEETLDGKQQKTRRVHLVLSETHQGLRIQMGTVLWTANAEADADALCALVERGLEKYAEQVTEVCAVAPLVNQSASQQLDYLGGGYARLIQERLLSQRGMVVVEIAEAQAITRELALGGDNQVTRRTPLFISGEFRHAGTDTQERVSLHLVLQRGNAKVAEFTRGELTPDAVGACLLEAMQTLLAKADTVAMPQWNATEQAAQLASQANLLKKTGNWAEALNVMDASLLLNPTQPQLLQDAALMCVPIVTSYEIPLMRKPKNPLWYVSNAEATLQYYYRIRNYLGAYLHQAPANTPDPFDSRLYDDFRFYMLGYLGQLLTGPQTGPSELKAAYQSIFEEWRDRVITLVQQDVAARKWNAHDFATNRLAQYTEFECRNYGYTEQQQYDLWLRNLRLTHEYSTMEYFLVEAAAMCCRSFFSKARISTPGFMEFDKQVAAIGGSYMQILADYLLVMYDGEHPWIELPPPSELPLLRKKSPPPQPENMPVAITTITPFTITFQDENGQPLNTRPSCHYWLPCGLGTDAMFDGSRLYLMKTKGVMKCVYKNSLTRMSIFGMYFDGRYIWVLFHNGQGGQRDLANLPKPYIVAVNTVSEKVFVFDEADGIIPSLTLQAAAWKPGSLIVAGYCGKSWCALLSISDDAKKTVDIIHEAHTYPDTTGWDPAARVASDIAYDPSFVMKCVDHVTGETQFLIGRNFYMGELSVLHRNPYPLIVDPVKRTVGIFPEKLPVVELFNGQHDILYYRDGWHKGPFVSMAYPDAKSHPVTMPFNNAIEGEMCYEGLQYHYRNLSKRMWWVSDSINGPYAGVKLDDIPKTYEIKEIFPSNCYGYVVCANKPNEYGYTDLCFYQVQSAAFAPKQ